MVQIFSIAFQLAGAIILLLWSLNGWKKENIIKKYYPGSNFAERDREDNCVLKKEKLQSAAKDAFINIAAFIDLIVGYATTFFANQVHTPWVSLLITILLTVIIILLEKFVVACIAQRRFPQDEIVSYDSLRENGVDSFATDEEVKEMLDDVFGRD